jgi:serine/threonine-protein kinase
MQSRAQIGKYTISGVIGEGAMGIVYRGHDPHLHRPVAVKTTRQALAGKYGSAAELAARFRNEARAAGRLSHPGVVKIYEYGEDAGTAFIAMEHVDGCTLERLLMTCPVPDDSAIVRVMSQLLAALDSAHAAGVVHRDIKPSNVMVTLAGGVKLADFGIARVDGDDPAPASRIAGTPGYIAPETFRGEPLDHRIDIFSAGVLLYRLLTGDSPFAGPPDEVRRRTLKTHPPEPSRITDGRRNPAFDAVVMKALAKRQEDRWGSAGAFRRALLEAAGLQRGTPMPPRRAGEWDVALLARIEHALAMVVGPLAKVLVRRAACRCRDAESLASEVEACIEDLNERAAFRRRVAAFA